MKYDKDRYLNNLHQYLNICSVEIRNDNQMRCPNNSAHKNNDKKFSAKLYTDGHPRVKCFACGFDGDIYDIAGHYNNEREFKNQYEIIDGIFGVGKIASQSKKTPPPDSKKIEKAEYKVVSIEEAKKIFTLQSVEKQRKFSNSELIKDGEIKGSWLYNDADNNIIAVDVRFEKDKEKDVITFWYDGKKLRFTGKINIIYNLYEALNTDKPIIIHEGCKCAEIGKNNLKSFCNISYNRGVENAGKPDWELLKKKKVYILPDNDNPGLASTKKIKDKLPNAIILESIYLKFEIDDIKSVDIEQIIEQDSIKNIENFILNYDEKKEKEFINDEKGPACLGIDDNNKLFFIDRNQRLYEIRRDVLSKTKLLTIAKLEYWIREYSTPKKAILWDQAIDDLLEESSKKEFESDKVRGRGAWKDGDNLVYHDGKTTYGNITNEYKYLRKNKRDIGINDKPASFDLTNKIRLICNHISFERKGDIIRLLGWSVLSPFSGALSWRPALLLTGESGSGKTTVLEKIVLPICNAKFYNAHHTSPAGIRADVGNDSCAICLDEAEGSGNDTTHDKTTHRNNLFGIMRASSSDNAPDGVKSNTEQQVVKYKMKNMFLFVSISPTVSNVADDNRIFNVNFVRPDKKNLKFKWEEVEKELINLLNKKNCRGIRALTWQMLPKIIEDANLINDVMKYEFNKTSRLAAGESILVSAYLNIFRNFDITKKSIKEVLELYYKEIELEEERDEVDELLTNILDYLIVIEIEKKRKELSIKEILNCLRNDDYDMFSGSWDNIEKELVRRLIQHGLKFMKDGTLAIAYNHKKIMDILKKEPGYHKILKRHRFFIADNKNVNMIGKSRKCIIIDVFRDEAKKENKELIEELPF